MRRIQGTAFHLIFVNRFFHPDHSATSQMLSDLAFALAEKGDRISVITSRQAYDVPWVGLPKWEKIAGVDVHRVPTSRFGRHSLPGRAVDYVTFYASAAWTLWRLTRRGDIVIAKTDPPMLSVLAAPIARVRGARYVNWLQDLFPEVAGELGVGGRLGRIAYRPLRWLRDRSLRSAEMNIVVGERMASGLIGLGVDSSCIRIIPNWADGDLIRPVDRSTNPLRRQWGLGEAFTVGYAGNLGRAHEIETVLEAIALTQAEQTATGPAANSQAIRWVFIGGGAQFGALESAVARRGLSNVEFHGYQPRERLAESLSIADVHLISLRPELEGLIVPSKFYGIAAAGRPTIFIGDTDGEISRLLEKCECGFAIAQGDATGLVRVLMKLRGDPTLWRKMGENARQAFDAEFSKSIAVARWDKMLREFSGPTGLPASTQAVRWVFIGGGTQFRTLKSAVARRGLFNVEFRGYQPREHLAESLSLADVHLVSLRPELEGLIVPSKFYGIAAVGRATIFIGDEDGEIPRLLKRYECGLAVAQGDASGLARVVSELACAPSLVRKMGENARRAFDIEFDKSIAVDRWAKVLGQVFALR